MKNSDKDTARVITRFFEEKNKKVGHNEALELVARINGFRNLHEMQVRAETENHLIQDDSNGSPLKDDDFLVDIASYRWTDSEPGITHNHVFQKPVWNSLLNPKPVEIEMDNVILFFDHIYAASSLQKTTPIQPENIYTSLNFLGNEIKECATPTLEVLMANVKFNQLRTDRLFHSFLNAVGFPNYITKLVENSSFPHDCTAGLGALVSFLRDNRGLLRTVTLSPEKLLTPLLPKELPPVIP